MFSLPHILVSRYKLVFVVYIKSINFSGCGDTKKCILYEISLGIRCVYSAGTGMHRNVSVIVPVSPYKILYSYVALVPAPSCIWQYYKFVHKFAGTLDTVFKISHCKIKNFQVAKCMTF